MIAAQALLLLWFFFALRGISLALQKRTQLYIFFGAVSLLAALPFANSLFALQVSDAAEYLGSALSIIAGDGNGFYIEGRFFPSRFPPGFAGLVLAPWLSLFPDWQTGAALYSFVIFLITGFAVASLSLTLWGSAAGFLSLALLFLLPSFRFFGGQLLSDPFAAACLVLLAMELISPKHRSLSRWNLLSTAVIALYLTAVRPPLFLVVPPLLYLGLRSWKFTIAAAAPSFAFLCSLLWYNKQVFGAFLWSGYHFWVPIPYAVEGMTFSTQFVVPNLASLGSSVGLLLSLLLALNLLSLFLQRRERRLELLSALCAAAAPIFLVYLPYFYSSPRFYLPLVLLTIALTSGGVFLYLRSASQLRPIGFTALGVAALAAVLLQGTSRGEQDLPGRLAHLKTVHQDGALVVSDLNPLLLNLFLQNGSAFPLSRKAEYASKAVLPDPIKIPMREGLSPKEQRQILELTEKAIDPYPVVFLEMPPEYFQTLPHVLVVPKESAPEVESKLLNAGTFSVQASGDGWLRYTFSTEDDLMRELWGNTG